LCTIVAGGRSALGQPKRGRSGHERDWELELIDATALRIDTKERDELRSELARYWLCLKSHPPPNIRSWKAFLTIALRNKALNWIRDQQTREKHFSSLDRPAELDDESVSWIEKIPSTAPEPDPESRDAMAAIYEALDPELKILLEALLEADGNQTKAAQLTGKHRNTVRAGLRKIREVLVARGFKPGDLADKRVALTCGPSVTSALTSKPRTRVAISGSLVGQWIIRRLSGTQWRILLWLLLETGRRKQRSIRARWPEIAHALSIHPMRALRAGRRLIRNRTIRAVNGKLQIVRQ
jgi:DNA-directed RNA polymerase specialized sigma24 family protein